MSPEFKFHEEVLLVLDPKELEMVKTALEILYGKLRLEISVSFEPENKAAKQLAVLLNLRRRLA